MLNLILPRWSLTAFISTVYPFKLNPGRLYRIGTLLSFSLVICCWIYICMFDAEELEKVVKGFKKTRIYTWTWNKWCNFWFFFLVNTGCSQICTLLTQCLWKYEERMDWFLFFSLMPVTTIALVLQKRKSGHDLSWNDWMIIKTLVLLQELKYSRILSACKSQEVFIMQMKEKVNFCIMVNVEQG